MNIENLEKLLERLQSERNPVAFDMAVWFKHGEDYVDEREDIMEIVRTHACGSRACLAGHAALLAYAEGLGRGDLTVAQTAQAWLNLQNDEAHELFHGWWEGWEEAMPSEISDEPDLELLTLDMAITEVTRLIRVERAK